jgi:hypothetical protein
VAEFIELAERCEKALGSDRGLDDAIMAALFRREDRMIGTQEEQDGGSWAPIETPVWVDPDSGQWVSTSAREFTSSIDAAMTLVPKGCCADTQQRKRIHLSPGYAEVAWARVETRDGCEFLGEATARTVPLAVAAAALRSKAAALQEAGR